MKPLGEARRHYWMVQRMADATGLDLARAQARGDLDQTTWAGVVQRCRGCAWVAGCERYLARGAADETLPEPCLNRHHLAALKVCDVMERQSEIG